MATIEELRARQADHSRQLESVLFVKVQDLAARWAVDQETIYGIPRAELPFIEYGKSKTRRYDLARRRGLRGSRQEGRGRVVSLYKGKDGIWEADARVVGVGRIHLSMRTKKKTEAEPRYDALRRLLREAKGPNGAERMALVDDVRSGKVPIERLTSMVASNEPLVSFRAIAAAAAWPTVDVAAERYLDWIKINPTRRKATWEAARAHLKRFRNFVIDGSRVGDRTLDQVTSANVEAYQRSLIDAKAAANTITGYMARVGALWAWMQRRENRSAVEGKRAVITIHNPLDPETTSRETSARDRWLTSEEATALLAVTPDRFRFAVAAGIFGGFRIGEILHLRTHVDIDMDAGTIAVAEKVIRLTDDGVPVKWKPKTKRAVRVVPIGPDLRPIMEAHLARFASSDWVMPAVEDPARPFSYDTFGHNFTIVVGNAGLVVGRKDPRGVVFHTLRHTFASWLVQRGVDLYTTAQLLGDTLQMVERTYAHLAPDYKKRAIEALKGAMIVPPSLESSTTETTTEAR